MDHAYSLHRDCPRPRLVLTLPVAPFPRLSSQAELPHGVVNDVHVRPEAAAASNDDGGVGMVVPRVHIHLLARPGTRAGRLGKAYLGQCCFKYANPTQPVSSCATCTGLRDYTLGSAYRGQGAYGTQHTAAASTVTCCCYCFICFL